MRQIKLYFRVFIFESNESLVCLHITTHQLLIIVRIATLLLASMKQNYNKCQIHKVKYYLFLNNTFCVLNLYLYILLLYKTSQYNNKINIYLETKIKGS